MRIERSGHVEQSARRLELTGVERPACAGQKRRRFAERAILLDAVRNHKSADKLLVLDRRFTYERLALPIQRGDDDFRLLVDRTLSKEFESAGYRGTYAKWFGEPDEKAEVFFRWNALPE